MKAVNPAVSCKRNRPRLMNFPIIQGFLKTMYIYMTQVSLNTPNIQNLLRDMAEKSKLHKLGMRLLLNPNKYGCEQLFLSTEYSKIGVVGVF